MAGIILILVGLFAVPWLSVMGQTASLIDRGELARDGTTSGGEQSKAYAAIIGYLAAFAQLANPAAVDARRTAREEVGLFPQGIRRRELTRENLWWFRTVFSGRAAVMLGIHVARIIGLFYKGLRPDRRRRLAGARWQRARAGRRHHRVPHHGAYAARLNSSKSCR
ncbi:hypothetical protein [Amycolatopsis sp.]|uniref:hypothetical protein n=1 Tax=Amycolatopsis sp. TaxID=37632 RepID=UPI002D10ACDA|nr:hypothetical protein [Amycolatopsis sp.]HVV13921.1 hypothetical protein [Amycolatopsis sp.]